MQNLLDLNLSDLVQTALTNKLATYFRGWNDAVLGEFWSVWKTSYFTIQQNESETNSITLNPFSLHIKSDVILIKSFVSLLL